MDKAMELLESLAVQLGVAVEHLWSILIKQQIAEGVTDIILSAFFIGIIVLTVIIAHKYAKRADDKYKELKEDRKKNGTGFNNSYLVSSFEEDHYENLKDNIPILAVVICLFALVLTLIFVVCGVQQIINPEYFALKEILNVISNG